MACFKGIVFIFIMLMIIGMVKCRWLEVEPYSTPSMISDGVDHEMNHENATGYLRMGSSMLHDEKRCHSIYGFLPCADTMPEGVFLMIMYTYLMMLGEDWIRKGSQALFFLLGDKAFGASVFRVLMALPRIVLVIVAGVLSTESAAQNQVAFGVSMYAGSTLITLTLLWGFRVILNRDKLRGKVSLPEHNEHQQDESTNTWSFKHALTILSDTGVNIDKVTGDIAVIMLLSLIPFATVELVALVNSPEAISFALVVSGVSLLLYFAYQIGNPWIQVRSLAYLKQENLRTRFFFHVQRLAEDDLIDEFGNPNFKAFESVFDRADKNIDDRISHEELEHLIEDIFKLEKDNISKEYAKAEILTHFDVNKSGLINRTEFKKGCSKWLKKWKNVASSNSVSTNLWKQVEKVAIRNKRADLTQIEKIMPRILKQVLEEHKLVRPNGEPDREKIEGLFSQYDEDSDDEIHRHELKKFIDTLHFGVSLDHDTVLEELIKDFDNDTNRTIEKHEFVEGFIKWIERAINYDRSIKDPIKAIAKFEEDSWAEIDTPVSTVKPKASIVYVIFGVAVMYLISGAFMQSVQQFSNAAHIPFTLTSFVVFPIALNARMMITALLNADPHVSKNASLTFSEIYSGLVMNNLLGLLTMLITVYMKGLSWTYSNEVLTIMIPCGIVGLFALKRDTYPLWTSILAMLLYPIYVYIYYVVES